MAGAAAIRARRNASIRSPRVCNCASSDGAHLGALAPPAFDLGQVGQRARR